MVVASANPSPHNSGGGTNSHPVQEGRVSTGGKGGEVFYGILSEASCAGLEKCFRNFLSSPSLFFAPVCLIGGGPAAQTHRHTVLLFPLFQSNRRGKKAQKARHSLFSKMSGVYFPPSEQLDLPSPPSISRTAHPRLPCFFLAVSPPPRRIASNQKIYREEEEETKGLCSR